ncbi:MAG: TIGR04133 family radical SAM/SPASM protein [Treponema sp.]|nr:TIGR04133 family radical SAM/SPASM protein [Treponema sp.]
MTSLQKLKSSDLFSRIIFRNYRKKITKKHQLTYLFWECTLKCNLNCLHCGSDCLKTSGIPDMPLQDFVKVLDNLKENGIKKLSICITGGEPLLRKDLEEAGREIRKHHFGWGIVTNGLLMTEERFNSLIASGMGSMSVSIDGLEAEHSYLRQNPESFASVEKTIRICVNHKKRHPKSFLYDVITCVYHGNIKTLPKLRDYLISEGVEEWRIFSIFPSGRASKNDLSLTALEYRELMDFIAETRKYKNPEGKSIHLNYSCEGYLGNYELKVRDYFFFCRGGINVGSVMCDGSLSACLSVRGKDFIQGNIYEENFDFMKIWNTRYENMRNRKWAKTGMCKKCKSWKWCEGNGLHLHKDTHSQCSHCNLQLLLDSETN